MLRLFAKVLTFLRISSNAPESIRVLMIRLHSSAGVGAAMPGVKVAMRQGRDIELCSYYSLRHMARCKRLSLPIVVVVVCRAAVHAVCHALEPTLLCTCALRLWDKQHVPVQPQFGGEGRESTTA